MGDSQLVLHTPEFAEAAGSDAGDQAVLLASKVMAMTAVDILTTPGCVESITDEFTRYKENGFKNVPGIPPSFAPLPLER
jgi:hypothetical protein